MSPKRRLGLVPGLRWQRFAQRGPGKVELKIWRITEVERYLFLY